MSMRTGRIVSAVVGLALLLFGVISLVTSVDIGTLALLAGWLVAAVVIHDGVLSPAVVAVGWALHRLVPPRARRYLQGGLIVAGIITVVAVPMISQQGATPTSKALLQQDFRANLALLLGLVAVVSLLLYAVRVARDGSARPQPSRAGSGSARGGDGAAQHEP